MLKMINHSLYSCIPELHQRRKLATR